MRAIEPGPAKRVARGHGRQMSKAFGVELAEYDHPDGGTYRGRTGPDHDPDGARGNRRRRLRPGQSPSSQTPFPDSQAQGRVRRRRPRTGNSQFTPIQIAKLYDFPANLDGTGQCIAIIELGGGFKTSDLDTYFSLAGHCAAPSVTSVSVDHASNTPTGSGNGPDGEVMLDIEVAGAIAPKAKIVVYFTPNTSQGFLDSITQADSRYCQQAIGHLDQLGRAGVDLDRPGDPAVQSGVSGRGRAWDHRLRRGG